MAVTHNQKQIFVLRKQGGFSLIELMIAIVVLLVGVVACMTLIAVAIGGNGRNRQQSNSTAIAQMVAERIMSVPANASQILTITDCSNTNNSVSTAPGGAPLEASGAVDFSQATVTNYSMSYTVCGTQGRQSTYDVRWNVQTLSAYAKLVTVSAKLQGAGTNPGYFSLPVTIRTVVGMGS